MGGAQGPIEIDISYTEEEYVSAARLFPYTRRRDLKFERGLMLVFLWALVLIFWLAGDPYLGGIMATLIIPSLAYRYYAERVRPRKSFRGDPKFRDTYAVTFAEEGIGVRTNDLAARFGWDYYQEVVETPDFFFFVYAEEFFFLVPKRALRPGQEATLGELLRRKLGAKMKTHGLPEAEARAVEREYVPPPEPPDWR
jgi:hypothetical protein